MKLTNILISLLLGSAVLLSGCTKKEKSDYGLDLKETFRLALLAEPPSLDWHKSTDTTSALVQDNIMEGLTDYNYNDPEYGIVPALAESWESSKDQKNWTFTIKKGVKWTDGQELKAQHFVDGWERLLNPKTASEYAYFIFNVKNAQKYNGGEIKDFSKVGVKADGDYKLVVELERSQSFFPALLNHHSTYPIRLDVVNKHGDDKWTDPENIVTLGAYTLKRWDHDKAIVLERNENYYGENAKTKYVLGYIVKEQSTALNMFDTGKVDLLKEVPSLEMNNLKKRDEFKITPILGIYYIGFNTQKPPFDDANLRKAVVQAIDNKAITDLLAGGEVPITGWLPLGMMAYDEDAGLKFDPEAAKKSLAASKYKTGDAVPKITLGFNTNENHQRIMENIQAQLKKNLGINAELKNEEWKVYLANLRTDAYHLFRMGWIADFADPDNFMGLMLSYSENNRGGWKNKKFDELVEKAVTIDDEAERKKMYKEAQRILLEEEAGAAPIYSYVNKTMTSKRVKNVPHNAVNKWKFKNVEIVK